MSYPPSAWHGRTFALVNANTGTSLGQAFGNMSNGDPVTGSIFEVNNTCHQWILEMAKEGDTSSWTLRNLANFKYPEIANGSNEDGRQAQVWARAPKDHLDRENQEWVITTDEVQQGAVIFRLKNVRGGNMLDLERGGKSDGAPVVGHRFVPNEENQAWRFWRY